MARDPPTTGRREGILRSLVACACGESSPKHGALRVLLLPIGVHAVFIRCQLALIVRSGCGVCPQLGRQILCCDFNVLYLVIAAYEGVSACLEAVFSEVSFKQHPAENCIAECSKCLFVVACRNM